MTYRASAALVIACLLITPRAAAAQSQFFTAPIPPPVAFPADAVLHDPTFKITTPAMIMALGNPTRTHNWFIRSDASGSMTITVQAGLTDGPLNGGGGTVTATVLNGPTTLATLTVTQPLTSPPVATQSVTIATVPSTTYRVVLTSPGGPAPLVTYELKLDGAIAAEFTGGPASVGPYGSDAEGTSWVVNVAAGEPLNVSILTGPPGAPCPTFPACPQVLIGTQVTVFDPTHHQRLAATTMPSIGGSVTIADAGDMPGPWVVNVVQPDQFQRSPYRIVKTSGIDPGVYAGWFTNGDSALDINISAPPAVASVDLIVSADVFTGYNDFGASGVQTLTIPTNQTISIDDPDVGQFHATVVPPAGWTAIPSQLDIPVTAEALTRIKIRIADTTPPALMLPSTLAVMATSPSGASATFTATAIDAIDGPLAVTCTRASGSIFAIGDTTVSCSTADAAGNAVNGQFHVVVVPSAPVCGAAAADSSGLWPPNHKFVPIAVRGVVNADGRAVTLLVTSIFQNEPTNGLGSGDTPIDGAGLGTAVAQVRAERSGTGTGRTYFIGFTATSAGGTCTGTVTVGVPHDQKELIVPGAPLYNSTQ